MSIKIIETHTILPDIISPGSVVVDCGENVGREGHRGPLQQRSRLI